MSVKLLDNYETNILKKIIEEHQNKTFIFEKLRKDIAQFSDVNSDFTVIFQLYEYHLDRKEVFYNLFQIGNLIGYRNSIWQYEDDIPETHNFSEEIDMDMFYEIKETFRI